MEDRTQKAFMGQCWPLLSHGATPNCKGIWKISLVAQETEKMSLGDKVFPEAHGMCADPQWHTHMFLGAHSCLHTCTHELRARGSLTHTRVCSDSLTHARAQIL